MIQAPETKIQRNRLLLSERFPLYYEDRLDEILYSNDLNHLLNEKVRRWKAHRIRFLFWFAETNRLEELNETAQILQREGFNLYLIPSEPYRSGRFGFFDRIRRFILNSLKQGSVEFLYLPGDVDMARILLGSLLVMPGKIETSDALRYISGRDQVLESDNPLFGYRNYLFDRKLSSEKESIRKQEVEKKTEQDIPADLSTEETPSRSESDQEIDSSALPSAMDESGDEITDFEKEMEKFSDLDLDLGLELEIPEFPVDEQTPQNGSGVQEEAETQPTPEISSQNPIVESESSLAKSDTVKAPDEEILDWDLEIPDDLEDTTTLNQADDSTAPPPSMETRVESDEPSELLEVQSEAVEEIVEESSIEEEEVPAETTEQVEQNELPEQEGHTPEIPEEENRTEPEETRSEPETESTPGPDQDQIDKEAEKTTDKDVRKEVASQQLDEALSIIHTGGLSLKYKLILIIAAIILVALSTMIILASYFFRNDNEIRIKENSLNLTGVIASKIEMEFESIIYRSRLLYDSLNKGNLSGGDRTSIAELFFQDNPHFIFIGEAIREGDGLKFLESHYNYRFMDDNGIGTEQIQNIHNVNFSNYMASFGGAIVIHNASPGSPVPILSLSLPVRGRLGSRIMVVYLDPSEFLKSFKSTGITTTYMVNNTGDIIAHPDSKLILTRANLSDLEIVKKMQESKTDNGQIRYKDQEGLYNIGSYKKLNIGGIGIISTVNEDRAFEEVYNIQRRNIYIMILLGNIAIIIVFFFSRTITIPIVKLVGATRLIEEGNYHVEIKASTKDEVGALTTSFVNMARGLEEREKMKDAFGRFVNEELAEQAMKGEIKLGGEKKEAAIFFSDLRGFTAMSEKLSPEEVVELLNEYFTDMVACVNNTGGVVDKFIGDAIMAHWGAVKATGADTENAVNAALMMRKALFEINKRPSLWSDKDRPFIKFGCGINTGGVISGQIGSETRLEFTVIGDAVNLASRIEALNKPFLSDILISQDSYNQVKDIYKVEKMPAITVKGKTEPQTIYAVVGRFDDPDCPADMTEVRERAGIDVDPEKLAKLSQDVLKEDKEEKFKVIGEQDKKKESV